jgi:acyl-coenzyme A synthetase/AMP-(fatty) acid ligase
LRGIERQADPALIVADDRLGDIPAGGRPMLARSALTAACARTDPLPAVPLDRSDAVAIIFSSGTTGIPKGYKAPDELVVVDELPMTAMLKPDRAALRKLIVERAGRP